MSLYRLKRGVHYHQGRRIAANSKTGGNVVELPDDHPALKETERWERAGEDAGAATGQQTGGAPQFLPASGSAQDAAVAAAATAPAHNLSEVLTSETVRGGAIPGVTEPLVGIATTSEDGTNADASTPGADGSTPTRDWYTYTIPQAVQHVRSASDLTTLAQYKNLELAPKQGKQRSKVLEAIDERAGELKREEK